VQAREAEKQSQQQMLNTLAQGAEIAEKAGKASEAFAK
jgi:hypothetical protein